MASEDTSVPSAHWLIPQLDLQTQLRQEVDRRTAAHMSRDELAVLADKLIVDWYYRNQLVDNLLARVRHMEVELALSTAKPSTRTPSAAHYEWAKELLEES